MGGWGTDRIVLDGFQNHLPTDSGGQSAIIRYHVGGKWFNQREMKAYLTAGLAVEAVEFSDDGRGYDYLKLGIDYSDKPDDQRENGAAESSPVGQFGEGQKLASASALIEGMHVEIFSRGWLAVPRMRRLEVDGNVVHQLCFDIYTADSSHEISGSRTIFYNPTSDFLKELATVEDKVLHLRPNYRPWYGNEKDTFVVDEKGDVFVKGMLVTSEYNKRLMFSYDLNTENIPRDRDHIPEDVVGNPIGMFIAQSQDKALIKDVLRRALHREGETHTPQNYLELEYISIRWQKRRNGGGSGIARKPAHPEVWREAFEELFGNNAVLATEPDAQRMARLAGRELVACDEKNYFKKFLVRCGIPQDKDVALEGNTYLLDGIENTDDLQMKIMETSYTLSHRAKKLNEQSMLLDAIANHMPADSGGDSIRIELRIADNERQDGCSWEKWKPGMRCTNMNGMRITDDGRGYHYTNLMYETSDKPVSAVGEFGRGLQTLAKTAVRYGFTVKFRSQDWVAMAFPSAPKRVGQRDEEVLCFHVLSGVPSIKGSVTTILGTGENLANLTGRLDDYVLPLRKDRRYLYRSSMGSMFIESAERTMKNGSIFNKGMFITDHYAERLLFSYDLQMNDISPDRDNVDPKELRRNVSDLVLRCRDREAIGRILNAAINSPGIEYMEFVDDDLEEDVAAAWREAFYKHAKTRNAVIFTKPKYALEAKHLGFKVIRLNEKVSALLHRAGVEYDAEVSNEGFTPVEVPFDELTAGEQQIIHRLPEVDEVLGLKPASDIRVFSEIHSRMGRDLTDRIKGCWDGRTLWLSRKVLASWNSAVRRYVHERAHKETDGGDAEDKFRLFFERHLAAFIVKELERKQTDPT